MKLVESILTENPCYTAGRKITVKGLMLHMRFIGGLQRLDGFCGEFDEELWTALLDHATVYTKDDIRFTFKVGDEVKVDG